MKVAILSDIHGNCYALERVLKAVQEAGVQKLLVLGDVVGYYYYPDKVLELLGNFPYEIIKGNHEVILQNIQENKISIVGIRKKYGRGHLVALEKLDQGTLDWLYALPFKKSVEIEGVHFQMNHGSPWDYDEYIYPDASRVVLEKCNSVKHDFVLIGHSHYSFSYKCKNCILINTGSVGQSRRKGGNADWVLVDTTTKEFKIMQTSYNTIPLIQAAKKIDRDITYNSEILTR